MKKSIVILLHIGFWGCYLVLTMAILGAIYGSQSNIDEAQVGKTFNTIFFFAIVPSAISFYIFYFQLFPKYFKQKKFIPAIVFGILVSLASALVGYVCLNLIYGDDCSVETNEDDPLFAAILFMAFIAFVSGVIAFVIQGFITWFEEIKLKETLKQKNQEMELALVKAQLDPHFLFNTINNIDVLILKNAETASNYLNKLSDIMRFMLYETKTDEILLSKEVEYIEKFIALQKIRTANPSYVNFVVEGNLEQQTIAPMVFIPFIENAFKHTNNKKLENAISIKIRIEKHFVSLTCENKFSINGQVKQDSNGLGNELIRKRLQLIYPEQHELTVSNQNNLYRVQLTINNG